MKRFIIAALCLVAMFTATDSFAKDKIAWSRYTGWEPLGYMQDSGILAKWNKKYGTDVEFVFVGDYIDSISLFASKKYQGVAVTNMDILSISGVGGRKATTAIIGDYSDGNDGVALKGYKTLEEAVKDGPISLVEYSVSQYLLAQCLPHIAPSLTIKDITTQNVTDADVPGIVAGSKKAAVVTWKPMLSQVKAMPGVNVVCDSSHIPGEIIDMVVVGDEVSPMARKAIVGAWYETLALIKAGDEKTIAALARQAGTTVDGVGGIKEQIATTHFFYTLEDANEFISDPKLKTVMDKVTKISFAIGAWQGVKSPSSLGIQFADGSTIGDPKKVVLVFDPNGLGDIQKIK